MKAFTFATIAAISVAHPHHGHEGRKHEHEHGFGEEHEHRHGDGHGHGKHPMRDWFKDNKHPILDGIKEITHDIFDVVHDKAEIYKSLFEDLKDRAKEEITMYDQPSLAGQSMALQTIRLLGLKDRLFRSQWPLCERQSMAQSGRSRRIGLSTKL